MQHQALVLFLCLSLIPVAAAKADERLWPTLEPGPHPVGFRSLDVTDYGRTVAPRVDWRGKEHPGDNFRQVRISVWYPAAPDGVRRPMVYRDYIEAAGFETRTARAALPPPPSAAEFATLLRTDVAEAREVLARAKKNDPEIELLDWMQLQDAVSVSPIETKLAILDLAKPS